MEQNQRRDQAGRPIQKEENFAPGNRPEQQQQKPAQGGFDKTGRNPHDENREDSGQKDQRDRETANQGTRGNDKGVKR